ncbi:aminotransferase class IV [Pedobacter sp. ISL-68]|uniref:aminotransferase class IV n=1 Tax=unclassified Pedobacter TaxID=2628915 RepID=UPI001BECEAD8|nr:MULTISPECIES: aminotransferase class IV [unclassified Pedobacter]MBT2564005.1 aminotransferase class IV [Pedobacter sp. ISL-64]MBT2592588.1 aminotransferase class IV [Pedobacter sp. ISL-68]
MYISFRDQNLKCMYISINNELVLKEGANISVSDLSIQRGYGIFDFLKTLNNKPIFIQDYFDRFYHSAKEMNLEVNLDRTQLYEAILKLITKNNIPNSGIKIILTGGFSDDGYTMVKPNLIIIQTPLNISEALAEKGLNLVSYNHQRQIPHVKTIDYLQAIRLQKFVRESNADDLLYHNNGKVRECPRANFFIITDNEIITAKNEILNGITRKKILGLNIPNYTFAERDFTLDELYNAKEAFISSSTKNAFPVNQVDEKLIGDGKNSITKLINDKLLALIELDQNS